MKNRLTVALSVLVDLRLNDGSDFSDVKEIIDGLDCSCIDTIGRAKVMGVDIVERRLIIDKDDEPEAE